MSKYKTCDETMTERYAEIERKIKMLRAAVKKHKAEKIRIGGTPEIWRALTDISMRFCGHTRKTLDFDIDTHNVPTMKTRNQISIENGLPLPTVIDRISKRRIRGKIVGSVLHYTDSQVAKILLPGSSGRPKSLKSTNKNADVTKP